VRVFPKSSEVCAKLVEFSKQIRIDLF
jgi:hypothetical protein